MNVFMAIALLVAGLGAWPTEVRAGAHRRLRLRWRRHRRRSRRAPRPRWPRRPHGATDTRGPRQLGKPPGPLQGLAL